MSIEIPRNDFGHIRVFEAKGGLAADVLNKTPQGLMKLLGTDALDDNYIDIIKINDLSSMQLTDYILQGYDVETESYDIPAENGIEGYAILVLSSAARGRAITLTPASGIRHVTTYVPAAQLQVIEPLNTTSADGIIIDPPASKPKSDARIGGMVATLALLVMFLLVALMVWVA